MADSDEHGALSKAFSGLGVDEKTLITILGRWHPEQRKTFRKGSRDFFIEDERQFERWSDRHVTQLRNEFLRIKEAIVLWTMHPWERDARLLKESLNKLGSAQYNILIEVACTRSSDELLGARKAYHSLFHRSIEEDVAFHVHGPDQKLLIAMVSSYRYEGPKVSEELAKTEAKAISSAIKEGDSELLIRVMSTRSIIHLNHVYKYYKEINGKDLDQDVEGDLLKETIQCLCIPATYFTKILGESLKYDADEPSKDAVTRVIVTRADHDMKQIKEEYSEKYGGSLANKIKDVANGSYKDFLLTLIARGD
ncbi:annexin D4 [Primulina eburnea]|uniref:annexin D4 n=1 Tax=Primulina eburnea TaxID=1245227 RepID=UPI003C6C32EA